MVRIYRFVAVVTLCALVPVSSAVGVVRPARSTSYVEAHSSLPGIHLVDDTGQPLPAPARSIAERILNAARHRDVAGIDALMRGDGTAAIAAQNKILKESGVFSDVVRVLTQTHGAPTDGETWPGFTMAQGHGTFDAADEHAMGVTNYRAYRGVRIIIGEGFPSGVWGFSGILAPTAPVAANTSGVADITWEYAYADRSTVEFTNFLYSGDSTGELKNMHWASWTSTGARGSGLNSVNDCNPNCADGSWHAYPVRVILSEPLRLSCGTIYTRAMFYQTETTALNSPVIPGGATSDYVTTDNPAQLCT